MAVGEAGEYSVHKWLRRLRRSAKTQGDAALDDLAANLIADLTTWLDTETWTASQRYLEDHPYLLSDIGETLLRAAIAANGDEELKRTAADHLQLLRTARRSNVAEAYVQLLARPEQMRSGNEAMDILLAEQRALQIRDAAQESRISMCRAILALDEDIHILVPRLRAETEITCGTALQNLADAHDGTEAQELLRAALDCYERAARDLHPDTDVSDWAALHNNLGNGLHALALLQGGQERRYTLERAIRCHEVALIGYNRAHAPMDSAMAQSNKGNALSDLGATVDASEREAILRQALACYDAALLEYQREVTPIQWASTQSNRGNLLGELALVAPERSRIELLHTSIKSYDAALSEITQANDPLRWAGIQNNKGYALEHLSRTYGGEQRKQALESAIACYDQALLEYHSDSSPLQWAMTHNNRGNAWGDLARLTEGTARIELLQAAITSYDAALLGRRREATPLDWAMTQNNKGNTLGDLAQLLSGDEQMRLLEEAITCYDAALMERRREVAPLMWASTQDNKGTALGAMAKLQARASRRRILQDAIACHDAALQEFDQMTTPLDWAGAQNNKANALSDLAQVTPYGRQASVFQHALACYDAALSIYTHNASPLEWADALHNRGTARAELASTMAPDDSRRLLREAISDYDAALLEYQRDITPLDWAITLTNKGMAQHTLSAVERGEQRLFAARSAVGSFTDARAIYAVDLMPHQHRSVTVQLIRAQLACAFLEQAPSDRDAWLTAACAASTTGLQAARLLERRAPSHEFRQNEWGESAALYTVAAIAHALSGDSDQAVALLEAGRARGLIESQWRRQADLRLLSPDEQRDYQAAIAAVWEIESRGRAADSLRSALVLVEEARQSNARLAALIERIQHSHPNFLATQEVGVRILQDVLAPDQALGYVMPDECGTLLVLVTPKNKPVVELLPLVTAHSVFELATQSDPHNGIDVGYLAAASGAGAEAVATALDTLLPALGDHLMERVCRRACELGARHLILVPGGLLRALPLHAATYPARAQEIVTAPGGRRYACDDILISYSPSATAYVHAHAAAKAHQVQANRGFVVGNPQFTRAEELWTRASPNYLPGAEREARRVAALMRKAGLQVTRVYGAQATRDAVIAGMQQATVAHLALHAYFDTEHALHSALLVAAQEVILLRDLLDERLFSPAHMRLLVLSACQTGFTDTQGLSEETVGMFGAVLASGVAGVTGSLWSVNDRSTAPLMEGFTYRYLCAGQEPAAALHNAARAQRELADRPSHGPGTHGTAVSDAVVGESSETDPVALKRHIRPALATSPRESPLPRQPRCDDHPVHWAAFVFYGA